MEGYRHREEARSRSHLHLGKERDHVATAAPGLRRCSLQSIRLLVRTTRMNRSPRNKVFDREEVLKVVAHLNAGEFKDKWVVEGFFGA